MPKCNTPGYVRGTVYEYSSLKRMGPAYATAMPTFVGVGMQTIRTGCDKRIHRNEHKAHPIK